MTRNILDRKRILAQLQHERTVIETESTRKDAELEEVKEDIQRAEASIQTLRNALQRGKEKQRRLSSAACNKVVGLPGHQVDSLAEKLGHLCKQATILHHTERQLSAVLLCAACGHTYHAPLVLHPCGHVFCTPCLVKRIGEDAVAEVTGTLPDIVRALLPRAKKLFETLRSFPACQNTGTITCSDFVMGLKDIGILLLPSDSRKIFACLAGERTGHDQTGEDAPSIPLHDIITAFKAWQRSERREQKRRNCVWRGVNTGEGQDILMPGGEMTQGIGEPRPRDHDRSSDSLRISSSTLPPPTERDHHPPQALCLRGIPSHPPSTITCELCQKQVPLAASSHPMLNNIVQCLAFKKAARGTTARHLIDTMIGALEISRRSFAVLHEEEEDEGPDPSSEAATTTANNNATITSTTTTTTAAAAAAAARTNHPLTSTKGIL